MHTYLPANIIIDGPITSLLSILCFLIEICPRADDTKGVNDFKFGTFIGRFPSDGMANTAVKG